MTVLMVTVTYGDRWHLLERVIEATLANGADHCLVVDNGSAKEISILAEERFGSHVTTLDLGRNLGSAAGFHAGLEWAQKSPYDYVITLDDDNLVTPSCIPNLLSAHETLAARYPLVAVFAVREGHGEGRALRRLSGTGGPSRDAAWGFDLMTAVRRRFQAKERKQVLPQLGSLEMEYGPYGGLLVKRSLLDEIGLPRTDFVLYQDDNEFTFRVTAKGGNVSIIFDAHVKDIDESWTSDKIHRNALDVWLKGQTDLKIYYTFRNQCYFNRNFLTKRKWLYELNRRIFIFLIYFSANMSGNTERFKLLRQAMEDALKDRLGERGSL